jgi:hypothetical protein
MAFEQADFAGATRLIEAHALADEQPVSVQRLTVGMLKVGQGAIELTSDVCFYEYNPALAAEPVQIEGMRHEQPSGGELRLQVTALQADVRSLRPGQVEPMTKIGLRQFE